MERKGKNKSKSEVSLRDPRTDSIVLDIANGLSNQDIADKLMCEVEEVVAIIKTPEIQTEIRKLQKEVMAQFGNSKEQVSLMMKNILLTDITEMYDDQGKLKPFNDIPIHLRQSITSIEFKHGEDRMGMPIVNTKVQVMDKMKAIEILARIEGLFDNNENTGGVEFKIGFE